MVTDVEKKEWFRNRVLVSTVGSAVLLVALLLIIGFWTAGFTLYQNIIVVFAFLAGIAGVLGAAWALWGVPSPGSPYSSGSGKNSTVPWVFQQSVTRGTIAMIIVCVFLGLLVLPLLFLLAAKITEAETTDLLKTIAAVVGGSVGIIIGFYFSESKQTTQGIDGSTYTVTFNQTGLKSGTPWSVTLHGNQQSSTGTSIVFSEPNGTHTYIIGNVPQYAPDQSSGSVPVQGEAVSVPVNFKETP
jgi:hypothetical protein